MKDDAVSSVVSAVLIFALFSTASLMWTLTQLPNWVEEREDNHAAAMREALGGMQATLEEMASTGNVGPATRTLALGPAPVPVLQRTPTLGTLGITDGLQLGATVGNGALHVLGAAPAGTPDAPLTATASDISSLDFLFLQLVTSDMESGEMAQVILSASDGAQTVTARIIQTDLLIGPYQRTSCDSMELHIQVTNTLGVTTTHVLQCRLGFQVNMRINLLADDMGLAAALNDLDPGYSMQWSSSASGADASSSTYGAVWRDSTGLTRVAGSGQASSYGLNEATQALVMNTQAQHFDAQELVWEAGALGVVQNTGMALSIEPTFDLAVEGTQGSLRWTLVVLAGANTTVSGDQATVSMRMTSATDVVLSADTGTFTFDGERAPAWRSYLQNLVDIGGVPDATVGGSGDSATLTLDDTTVTQWTVHLRIIQASLSLR